MSDAHEGHDHSAHADEEEAAGLSVTGFKVILLFVYILVSLLPGLMPTKLPFCKKNPVVLSFLNSFSAGIFLGMALIHMMPEGVELYNLWAKEQEIEEPFPMQFVMFFLGYLLILLVDKVVVAKCHKAGSDTKVDPTVNPMEIVVRSHLDTPKDNK